MTRKIFFQCVLTLMMSIAAKKVHTSETGTYNRNQVFTVIATENVVRERVPLFPQNMGLKPPSHSMHAPVMEELPKVHRFHRERVKKVKKHQSKLWVSLKLLLLISHLALLICAFLHATH